MSYPNLNTPKLGQATNYAPNPSPTDPQTNPLARPQVNGQFSTPTQPAATNLRVQSPGYPFGGAGAGAFGQPVQYQPGAVYNFAFGGGAAGTSFATGNATTGSFGSYAQPYAFPQPNGGVLASYGPAGAMWASNPSSIANLQFYYAYFVTQQISNRVSRPILSRHHQQFYSSLSVEQRLQFFGNHSQDAATNRKHWEPLVYEINVAQQTPAVQGMQGMYQPNQMQPNQMQMPFYMPPVYAIPAAPAAIQTMAQQQVFRDIAGEFQKRSAPNAADGGNAASNGAVDQSGSAVAEQRAADRYFFTQLRQEIMQKSDASFDEIELLAKKFQLRPSLDEIKLDCRAVSGFALRNDYGEVSFSGSVDLSNVKAEQFSLSYADFELPFSLRSKKFIVVMNGVWNDDDSDQTLKRQAEDRGMRFVFYNRELKKLMMSSK